MTTRRTAFAPSTRAAAAKIHTYTTGTIDQIRSTHEVSFVISDATQQKALTTAAATRTRASGSIATA